MTSRVFLYEPRVAGSTFDPITIELKDINTGLALDLTGATVTVTITDETSGEIILDEGVGEPNEANPFWVDYWFTDEDMAKVTRVSTWLAQWTVTGGNGRPFHHPTVCRIPVRPRTR